MECFMLCFYEYPVAKVVNDLIGLKFKINQKYYEVIYAPISKD